MIILILLGCELLVAAVMKLSSLPAAAVALNYQVRVPAREGRRILALLSLVELSVGLCLLGAIELSTVIVLAAGLFAGFAAYNAFVARLRRSSICACGYRASGSATSKAIECCVKAIVLILILETDTERITWPYTALLIGGALAMSVRLYVSNLRRQASGETLPIPA